MSRRGTYNVQDEFRELKARSDYAMSKPSRFRRTRNGLYGSADSHYANEAAFLRDREYIRDMDRNDMTMGAAINRITVNEVQTGYRPEPNTGDAGLDAELKEDFREWALNPSACDARGEMSFAEMEYTAARAERVDGDIFALP